MSFELRGNAPDGKRYAKIANVLNRGINNILLRKLKGLEDKAVKRFEEKLKG